MAASQTPPGRDDQFAFVFGSGRGRTEALPAPQLELTRYHRKPVRCVLRGDPGVAVIDFLIDEACIESLPASMFAGASRRSNAPLTLTYRDDDYELFIEVIGPDEVELLGRWVGCPADGEPLRAGDLSADIGPWDEDSPKRSRYPYGVLVRTPDARVGTLLAVDGEQAAVRLSDRSVVFSSQHRLSAG